MCCARHYAKESVDCRIAGATSASAANGIGSGVGSHERNGGKGGRGWSGWSGGLSGGLSLSGDLSSGRVRARRNVDVVCGLSWFLVDDDSVPPQYYR